MGGSGSKYGGSHGMGGGGAAAKAAAPQTRAQKLLAVIYRDPEAFASMNDDDALETVKAIEQQTIPGDGSQNDTFCQRYLNAIGYTREKPEVLDEKAFEKARKQEGAQTLYHSDAPYDGHASTARKTLKQLQTGDTAYASFGVHGSGTYLDTYASSNARQYAGMNGSQVKMFFNQNASVADWAELYSAETRFKAKHPKTYQHLRRMSSLGRWGTDELKTVWLTSAGFNAYDSGHYKVAYSRKALTVCTTIKSRNNVISNHINW